MIRPPSVLTDVAAPTPSTAMTRSRFLLLIVDPDEGIGAVAEQFGAHDVDVVVCADTAEALLQAGGLRPDAVLAAANLHPVDSATLVRVLRQRSGIPVLLGIGTDEGGFAAAALAAGASACVARPYRLQEMLPILRAIRSDTTAVPDHSIEVGVLRLNPATLEVSVRGRPVALPLRECRLLHLLMVHAGRVVTRDQIRAEVWSSTSDVSNTVTVHIQRLRHRLGDNPSHPTIILTVRGIGYRLVLPKAPPEPPPDRGHVDQPRPRPH